MTSDAENARNARSVLDAPVASPPPVEDVIQAAMAWHFSEATGARFWLDRAKSLPFDPRTEIRTTADLTRFPDVSDEWREVPIEDLIPRGCLDDGPPEVFESGGTTGPPKRLVTGLASRAHEWLGRMLDRHDFHHEGNLLHIGPTGPHFFARDAAYLAARGGGAFFTVDLDPRWIKRCVAGGRDEEAGRYLAHVLDQVEDVLRSQQVTKVTTTPALLEAIAGRPALADLFRAKVRAAGWGGMSMSRETRRLLETEVFPDMLLVGVYGNTMMGTAPQRPRLPGDAEDCVFQPFHPYVILSVCDPGTREEVEYGRRGRVRFHRLGRDVFLPNAIERDTALWVAPVTGFPGGAIADVRPVAEVAGTKVVEGVY